MKEIIAPTEEALVKSASYQIRMYNIFLVLWLAGVGYFAYSRDAYWLIYSIFFFVAAITFYLGQKIDKARLEILRKA